MNDKRFVLIEDDLEPLILDNKETMSVNEVVDLLNEQQAEIERLKKKLEPKFEDNQETEIRECQFCGEFRTEYHEYEDYSWSAEDYCNAGHDLEDTDPNTCKDYWDDD